MNDQALNDAYNLFSSQGYKGSIDEFKSLISSNGNALNDAHKLFSSKGYNGDVNEFKGLMGIGGQQQVKKKSFFRIGFQVGRTYFGFFYQRG